jgi:hypothetical protein
MVEDSGRETGGFLALDYAEVVVFVGWQKIGGHEQRNQPTLPGYCILPLYIKISFFAKTFPEILSNNQT